MVWFNVDDTLAFHGKAIQAGNAAIGLWTRAGSWCCSTLTDGFVPTAIARSLGTIGQCKALVNAGLWIEVEGGYRFHEWEQRQQTKAEVESKREADRIRKADQRRRKNVPPGQPQDVPTEVPTESQSDAPEESQGDSQVDSTEESAPPIPSIPFPASLVPNGTKEREPRKRDTTARGHRLPEGWEPSEAVVRQMREECPNVNLRTEHAKFADHWKSQPGAKGRKADWTATWRNWMRRTAENLQPRARPQTNGGSALTTREQEFLKTELLKDNPDPDILRRAGIDPATHLKALPGGI